MVCLVKISFQGGSLSCAGSSHRSLVWRHIRSGWHCQEVNQDDYIDDSNDFIDNNDFNDDYELAWDMVHVEVNELRCHFVLTFWLPRFALSKVDAFLCFLH